LDEQQAAAARRALEVLFYKKDLEALIADTETSEEDRADAEQELADYEAEEARIAEEDEAIEQRKIEEAAAAATIAAE
jgi:hypothetical protein